MQSAADLFAAQRFHASIGSDILGQCILTHNGSAMIMILPYFVG